MARGRVRRTPLFARGPASTSAGGTPFADDDDDVGGGQVFRKSLLWATALSATLILGAAGVAVRAAQVQAEAWHWLVHTREVLEEIERASARLRSHQVSRDVGLLEVLRENVERLATLTSDNASQAEEVEALRSAVLRLADEGGLAATPKPVASWSAVESRLDRMRGEEMRLLSLRRTVVREAHDRALISTSALAVASIALLLMLSWAAARDAKIIRAGQRQLQSERAKLALALRSGGMGFWEWDMASNKSRWDEQEFDLLGIPPSPDGVVVTDRFLERIHPEDKPGVLRIMEHARATSSEFHGTFRVEHPSRGIRWLAGRGSVMREGNTAPRMIGLNWDVTEMKQREIELAALTSDLELRVAERTRALEDANGDLDAFANTIAHDLRAPLRNIHGYSSALIEDEHDRLSEQGKRYAARLGAVALKLNDLIEDLLVYSRLARSELSEEAVNLDDVLDWVLQEMGSDLKRRNARILRPDRLPTVRGHKASLIRVFSNLLANAVKFVELERSPEVSITWVQADSRVRVIVTDNGIGIAQGERERIFEIFTRLHAADRFSGTGIGLAIVQRAVERMGGRVHVEAPSGGGSRFVIELRSAGESTHNLASHSADD
jgi:signal transduction histidine kinase